MRTIAGCFEHVAELPANDSPQVLGLHPNADISFQINRSAQFLCCRLELRRRVWFCVFE